MYYFIIFFIYNLLYCITEPLTLVIIAVKGLLVLALLTFVIQFLGKRLKKIIFGYRSSGTM